MTISNFLNLNLRIYFKNLNLTYNENSNERVSSYLSFKRKQNQKPEVGYDKKEIIKFNDCDFNELNDIANDFSQSYRKKEVKIHKVLSIKKTNFKKENSQNIPLRQDYNGTKQKVAKEVNNMNRNKLVTPKKQSITSPMRKTLETPVIQNSKNYSLIYYNLVSKNNNKLENEKEINKDKINNKEATTFNINYDNKSSIVKKKDTIMITETIESSYLVDTIYETKLIEYKASDNSEVINQQMLVSNETTNQFVYLGKKKKKLDNELNKPVTSIKCKCVNSQCQKAYCVCYSAKVGCGPDCLCVNCLNLTGEAIKFNHKRKSIREEYCNCENSGCLKRYCQCFKNRRSCGIRCRCMGCKNKQCSHSHTDNPFKSSLFKDTDNNEQIDIDVISHNSNQGNEDDEIMEEDKKPQEVAIVEAIVGEYNKDKEHKDMEFDIKCDEDFL